MRWHLGGLDRVGCGGLWCIMLVWVGCNWGWQVRVGRVYPYPTLPHNLVPLIRPITLPTRLPYPRGRSMVRLIPTLPPSPHPTQPHHSTPTLPTPPQPRLTRKTHPPITLPKLYATLPWWKGYVGVKMGIGWNKWFPSQVHYSQVNKPWKFHYQIISKVLT